jgi:hypothetical protein
MASNSCTVLAITDARSCLTPNGGASRISTDSFGNGNFGLLVLDMMDVSDSTRSGNVPATICEIIPPIDTPTR